jgi:hypothetical protein
MSKIREASEKLQGHSYRLMPFAARLVTGGTAAFAALSACYGLFGAYSDLSAIQLAAGPRGTQLGETHRSVLSARTGRGWAAAEAGRVEHAAGSAATTRVVRGAVPPTQP